MNKLNYGTPEACKKLAEVLARKGIALVPDAEWCRLSDGTIGVFLKTEFKPGTFIVISPAYSMPKVWRELPDIIISDKFKERICRLTLERDSATGETYASYENYQEKCAFWAKSPNPADALIYLWIWVLEQEGK